MDNKFLSCIESKAVLRYVRITPTKIRRVTDQIRGKTYKEALILLEFLPYACSKTLIKVLRSAAANAQQTHGIDQAFLKIKTIAINKGPTIKRFRPRARGRSYSILKSTSHITIILIT
jgi:large subunit ribosomal protein L22